jgi:hypothetical protein
MYLMGVYHVIAAFGGRWPSVAFLILALSGKLALGPIAPGTQRAQIIKSESLEKSVPTKDGPYQGTSRQTNRN